MTQVKWGIIGPGTIAHNFAQGLAETESGVLHAIAGRSADRVAAFGEAFGVDTANRFGSVQSLLGHNDVDAIYIATPHPFHAQQAIDALRAGKAVLCEKPGGLTANELNAVCEVAAQEGQFYMEGLMYRAHPQIARMLEIIESEKIGTIRHIATSFGFDAPVDPNSRLFDPALAGGAILDVGLYPISLVRLVAGAANGKGAIDPIQVSGVGVLGETGVDEVARAHLLFEDGITAECATGITMNMANDATITGTLGTIRLVDPWTPGRNEGPSDAIIEITIDGETTKEFIKALFAFRIDLE